MFVLSFVVGCSMDIGEFEGMDGEWLAWKRFDYFLLIKSLEPFIFLYFFYIKKIYIYISILVVLESKVKVISLPKIVALK